jgi:hypothetical protein
MYPNLPAPVAEYKFHPSRKWRLDYAWPDLRCGVELHGGGYGRHNTVTGLAGDLEKSNAAVALGWRVLGFSIIAMKTMPSVVDEVAALVVQARAA